MHRTSTEARMQTGLHLTRGSTQHRRALASSWWKSLMFWIGYKGFGEVMKGYYRCVYGLLSLPLTTPRLPTPNSSKKGFIVSKPQPARMFLSLPLAYKHTLTLQPQVQMPSLPGSTALSLRQRHFPFRIFTACAITSICFLLHWTEGTGWSIYRHYLI